MRISFDIIGSKEKSIAVVEVPKGKSKKKIAEHIMKQHKNVKSVLDKGSPRTGKFRLRKHKIIAGTKDTEVTHKESGCRFIVDPQKVYFSPREGAERLRIASKVRKHEVVMVFFAGMGPFCIIIAKKAKPKKVIGIEINPDAIDYFDINVVLNKTRDVVPVLGDVKKKAKDYYRLCDRVLMPLPESSLDYLKEAIKCLKKNGVCHVYTFCREDEEREKKEKIRKAVKKAGRKIKFISIRKVLPYGPRIYKTRIDFKVV